MPLSPIANMNFINQNMTYPATQVSNELAKEGFAATLNMAEFNEKEKTLNKLEKVNEVHEIKEEIQEKTEQEEKKKKHNQQAKTDNDEENAQEDLNQELDLKETSHHLDISI